jgi:hypothetical protein
MQVELIENPLILPTCNGLAATLARHDDQRNSCALRGYSVSDETKPTEEQIRLLLSWRAVLREIGSSELGASQW